MRRRGLKIVVDLDEAARIGLDTGGGEVETGRLGYPSDGGHDQGGLERITHSVLGDVHADAARGLLERPDGSDSLADLDAHRAQRLGDRSRDLGVFGGENARSGLHELNASPERVEDRGHLQPGHARAHHQQRSRHLPERPRVAVGRGQLAARDSEPAARAARAQHHSIGRQSKARSGLDGVSIPEAGGPRVLVDPNAESIDLVTKRGMIPDLGDHLTDPFEQSLVVQLRR